MKMVMVDVKGRVRLHRQCSRCEKNWSPEYHVGGSGQATPSLLGPAEAQAKAQATAEQEWRIREAIRNAEMVCPDCNHLAKEAIEIHFKDGYLAGLKARYVLGLGQGIGSAIVWSTFLLLWVVATVVMLGLGKIKAAGLPASLFIVALLGMYPGYLWYWLVRGRRRRVEVFEKLASLTTGEHSDLIVRCYKLNKDDKVQHGSFDVPPVKGEFSAKFQVGISPWIKVPLSLLDPSSPSPGKPG